MTLPTITPAEAHKRLTDGSAVLVDIREPTEHARESIPGARLAPLSEMKGGLPLTPGSKAVIFHCQGGRRTAENAAKLAQCNAAEIFLLEGGLSGWKSAGLKTALDRSKPIEMQRQVQIAAGSLVVLGLLLAALISPWFVVLSAFVGCGLIFAGVSGWCGMAHLLAVMPWNRTAT